VIEHEVEREQWECTTEEARFNMVANVFSGSSLSEPAIVLDTLFEVQYSMVGPIDLDIDGPDGRRVGPFDLVLLGAPVWVRELPERLGVHPWIADALQASEQGRAEADLSFTVRPIAHIEDPVGQAFLYSRPSPPVEVADAAPITIARGGEIDVEKWTLFDTWLQTYLRVMRNPARQGFLEAWPPDDAHTPSFLNWFIGQACLLGASPLPLAFPTPRRRLAGFRREWGAPYYHSGRYGFFVPRGGLAQTSRPSSSDWGVLIDVHDASVWPAMQNGFYRGSGEPQMINMESTSSWPRWPHLAADVLRMVGAWRLPFFFARSCRSARNGIQRRRSSPLARW
jgi:hypothetical protein